MNSFRTFALIVFAALVSTLAVGQTTICVSAIGGGDAPTWNIQERLYKAIETEAKSRGDNVTLQLMTTSNEKQAKDEMHSLKCNFALITNTSREWPTPKASDSLQAGGATVGGGGKNDNPHPPSIAHFHFLLLDKNGKKLDKYETQIEMQLRYTAKDVETDLAQIIQEMANWTLDGSVANK